MSSQAPWQPCARNLASVHPLAAAHFLSFVRALTVLVHVLTSARPLDSWCPMSSSPLSVCMHACVRASCASVWSSVCLLCVGGEGVWHDCSMTSGFVIAITSAS